MPPQKKAGRPDNPEQLVTPPFKMRLRDARKVAECAEWEGMSPSDYYRSAIRTRIRETDMKRAEYERRIKDG